jgi:hypothetical protein
MDWFAISNNISLLSTMEAIAACIAIAGVFVNYFTFKFNKKQLKQKFFTIRLLYLLLFLFL